jgi:dTDP-4-amino-4,6-dideoxygalactose transaminase
MPQWTKIRTQYAQKILEICKQYNFINVHQAPDHIEHAFYKCYVMLDIDKLPESWSRDKIITAISEQGIPCFSGSCSEVYKEKAFDSTGYQPKKPLKNAQQLGKSSLMFLVHPTLTSKEISKTCEVLKKIFSSIK